MANEDAPDPALSGAVPDDELLDDVATAKKRKKKVGRKIGFQENSTRIRMNLVKRATLVQDVMNLHSAVMHTVQILIDRVAGLEARFAALAEDYAALPAVATSSHALLQQLAADQKTSAATAVELLAQLKSDAVQSPAAAPVVPTGQPTTELTFEQICLNLYKEQGYPAFEKDGPALVKLFDFAIASLPSVAPQPERVQKFIELSRAVTEDQKAQPSDWDFDFIV